MLATAAKKMDHHGIKEKPSQRNITAKIHRLATNFTRVVDLFPAKDLARIKNVFITDSPGFISSPFFLTNDYQILFVRSQEQLRKTKTSASHNVPEFESGAKFNFQFQFQDENFENVTRVDVLVLVDNDKNEESCLVSNEHLCSEVSRPSECESFCGEGAKSPGGKCQWVPENRSVNRSNVL